MAPSSVDPTPPASPGITHAHPNPQVRNHNRPKKQHPQNQFRANQYNGNNMQQHYGNPGMGGGYNGYTMGMAGAGPGYGMNGMPTGPMGYNGIADNPYGMQSYNGPMVPPQQYSMPGPGSHAPAGFDTVGFHGTPTATQHMTQYDPYQRRDHSGSSSRDFGYQMGGPDQPMLFRMGQARAPLAGSSTHSSQRGSYAEEYRQPILYTPRDHQRKNQRPDQKDDVHDAFMGPLSSPLKPDPSLAADNRSEFQRERWKRNSKSESKAIPIRRPSQSMP